MGDAIDRFSFTDTSFVYVSRTIHGVTKVFLIGDDAAVVLKFSSDTAKRLTRRLNRPEPDFEGVDQARIKKLYYSLFPDRKPDDAADREAQSDTNDG